MMEIVMRILLAGIILTLSAVMLAPSAFGSSGVRAPDAKICKDCPFPMRVGENRWKMPNGHVEIEILKKKLPNRWEQIQVRLVDTRDGRILAEGIST
ncbi:MAG: hypothetical protein V4692_14190, partial [Bdellovibrionota bacterium]